MIIHLNFVGKFIINHESFPKQRDKYRFGSVRQSVCATACLSALLENSDDTTRWIHSHPWGNIMNVNVFIASQNIFKSSSFDQYMFRNPQSFNK